MNRVDAKVRGAVFLFIAVIVSSCAGAITPQSVAQSHAQRGARATLETYFGCDTYEDSAYAQIATGARPWILIAEEMLAQSDACYTEGIQAALGQAMRNAPATVLALVGKTPQLDAEYICLPFISAELPIAAQLVEIDRSRQAILSVDDGAVTKNKTACLAFIDGLSATLRAQMPASPER